MLFKTAFEVIALICSACGVIMVCGGIFLLYKGIISMPKVTDAEAISIEIKNAMKDFKLSTTAPALAFFIIGLFFIIIPLYMTKPSRLQTIQFRGKILNAEGAATLYVKTNSWKLPESDDMGNIQGTISPSLNDLIIEISAPGKTLTILTDQSKINNGTILLGEIKLRDVVKKDALIKKIAPMNNFNVVSSVQGTYGGINESN